MSRWGIQIALACALFAGSALAQTSTVATSFEVVVRDTRVGTPFDPDALLQLGGKQIRDLGVTNLGEALAHVHGVDIRAAGRGGTQVDIRGGRKGAVLILIDGMPVAEPFTGNFDISSIPVTDIAEIRVSQSPASPIDGPGGPGGVVEVITRSAAGDRRLSARIQGSSAPAAHGAVTAKGSVGESGLALRVSAGGSMSARQMAIAHESGAADSIGEEARTGDATILAEYVGDTWRVGADFWGSHRRYLIPPGEGESSFTLVDHEESFRASVLAEAHFDEWTATARAFAQLLQRDAASGVTIDGGGMLRAGAANENLLAHRSGAFLQARRQLFESLKIQGSMMLVLEDARGRDMGALAFEGAGRIFQSAAAATYTPWEWLRVDGAVGAAVPIGDLAAPWPEGKLSIALSSSLLRLELIGARKGRVPTLRERYAANGNPNLDVEMSTFGEAKLSFTPWSFAALTGSAYARRVDGLIRFDGARASLGNVGDITIRGFDARLDLGDRGPISGGAAYTYADAGHETLGPNPLDFFPKHRADAWISARSKAGFGGNTRLRFIGERVDRNQNLAPYATVDASAWYEQDGVRVTARAENLLDAGYEARAGVVGFGRTLFMVLESTWK